MTSHPMCRKVVLLGLVSVLMLGMTGESRAEDGCLSWLWPGNWFSSRTTYAPPYPGPMMAPPSTGYGVCAPAPVCCPAPTCCVPQTSYRTVVDRIPVTTYMPVVTSNPCTGCAVTAYRPSVAMVRQVRLIPYTTSFMGYSGSPCSTCVSVGSCVGGSCGMLGFAPAGGCSSCTSGGCFSGSCVGGSCDGSSSYGMAVAPGGCSSCSVPSNGPTPATLSPTPAGGASTPPSLPGPVAPDQANPSSVAPRVPSASGSTSPQPTFAPPSTPATPSTPVTPPATYRNQSLPTPSAPVKPIPDLGPGYRPLPLPRPSVSPDSRTTSIPVQPSATIQLIAATPRLAAAEQSAPGSVSSSDANQSKEFSGWRAARD